MPRPNFPFPGYWLGINGKIQVHMGPAGIPNQEMYYLGTPKNAVHRQLRRGRPHRVPRLRAAGVRQALQEARHGVPAAQPARVGALPALHQGPERPHHRAQFLRHQGGARLGRRGLLQDGAGGRRDERPGTNRPGVLPASPTTTRSRARSLSFRRCASARRAPKTSASCCPRRSPTCTARASCACCSPSAGAGWSSITSPMWIFPRRSRAAAPRPAGTSATC